MEINKINHLTIGSNLSNSRKKIVYSIINKVISRKDYTPLLELVEGRRQLQNCLRQAQAAFLVHSFLEIALLIGIFCIASNLLTGCSFEQSYNESNLDSERSFTYVNPLAEQLDPKYFFISDFSGNEIDAITVDVLSFSAKFCHSKEDFICIESDILTFAVPRTKKLSNINQWMYKKILFENRRKTEIKILVHSIEVWKIEAILHGGFGESKCKFLYTPKLGLVSFGFFYEDGLNKTYILSGTQGILAHPD